jgi:ADP-heptose:LPS heptosyltransferase
MSPEKRSTVISTSPRRILLPRFDTFGDIMLLEGFLEALLERFSDAEITLLVRSGYDQLSSLFPRRLRWLTIDIDPYSTVPSVSSCKSILSRLGTQEWDLVLVTAFCRTWAADLVAMKMSQAQRFAVGEWDELPISHRLVLEEMGIQPGCPYDQMIPVNEKSHETEKYAALWRALAGQADLPEPRLVVSPEHQAHARKILGSVGFHRGAFCVCLPTGTQNVSIKTWPEERFAEVIAWIEQHHGLPSLVIGHHSEESHIQKVVQLAKDKNAHPQAWLGRNGEIPIMAALLSESKIYVGNDSGAMHMAAALNVPAVGVFGGGTWPRFIARGRRSVSVAGDMPCFGCGWSCIFGDAPCMLLVTVGDVKKAVGEVLSGFDVDKKHPSVLSATTKLNSETSQYVAKAYKVHRQIEADRVARLEQVHRLGQQVAEIEADRKARLEQIHRLGQQLGESEADRAARLEVIHRLGQKLAESEADRAARLEVIHRLGQELAESEANGVVLEHRVQDLEVVMSHPLVRTLIKLRVVQKPKRVS